MNIIKYLFSSRVIYCLFIFFNSFINLFGQTQFQRAIREIHGSFANSMIKTSDGGYAAAGSTNTYGNNQRSFYILKLDAAGMIQWTKTVDFAGWNVANSIIQTTDRGYAVAGWTDLEPSAFFIVKLDSTGAIQWNKYVRGNGSDVGNCIIQTLGGGYAIAGTTNSFGAGGWDAYIVKLDSNGAIQWSKTIGAARDDYAESIVQSADSGYVIAGYTNSFGAGDYDIYVAKLDSRGNHQWSKTIGGIDFDFAWTIIKTADGGYAVAGATSSFGAGGWDAYFVKLDSNGTLQWTKTLGGQSDDWAQGIVQTADGGFAIAGDTYSFGAGNDDLYAAKLDSGGKLVWSRTVGGSNADVGWSIVQTTDGSYVEAGWTTSFGAVNSDVFIVKFDSAGNTCGNTTTPQFLSGTGGIVTNVVSIVNAQSPIISSPVSLVGSGGVIRDICVIGIQPVSNEIPQKFSLYQNYPNPFNPSTTIKFDVPVKSNVKLEVYDITGKELSHNDYASLQPGTYKFDWNAENNSSGVYFYRITVKDNKRSFVEVKKMVLLK